MKKYYKVVAYNKYEILNERDKRIIDSIFSKFHGKFYLTKSSKKGYNIAFNGISNYAVAEEIKKIIEKINRKLSYDVNSAHIVFNDVVIEEDNKAEFFLKDQYYNLYRSISIKMDNLLYLYYFTNVLEKKDIISYINSVYEKYDKKDFLYISHFSHFWGFLMNLEDFQKCVIYENLKIKEYNIYSTDIFLELFDFILKQVNKLLIENSEFNFYFPRDVKKIYKEGNISSVLHKRTLEGVINGSDELFKNKYAISNAWFLNCLYEKLIIMNINLIDKYCINFYLAKYHSQYDINKSIEHYICEKEEKIVVKE